MQPSNNIFPYSLLAPSNLEGNYFKMQATSSFREHVREPFKEEPRVYSNVCVPGHQDPPTWGYMVPYSGYLGINKG